MINDTSTKLTLPPPLKEMNELANFEKPNCECLSHSVSVALWLIFLFLALFQRDSLVRVSLRSPNYSKLQGFLVAGSHMSLYYYIVILYKFTFTTLVLIFLIILCTKLSEHNDQFFELIVELSKFDDSKMFRL